MNNLRLTLNQKLPGLTRINRPNTRMILIGFGIALAIFGLVSIYAFYAAILLFAGLTVSYVAKIYQEVNSINFNDIKYSITMEEIIEDLEGDRP